MRPLLVALLVGGVGCAEQPLGHPMAFFTMAPEYVCDGDDHQTVIRFDATQSAPNARLVIAGEAPDEGRVDLAWSVLADDFGVVEGDLRATRVAMTFPGARPVTIRLTVTNTAGQTATDARTVGVIFPTAAACKTDDDCSANETCAPRDGQTACLPTRRCDTDDQCPACYRCDVASRWCTP